ncbi:MAG: hypothetical protein Q8N71_01650, partial [candidate division Zixibacteria bacterium]|nr:hypothetical protein [candidate division Zixibacteria bacterium]
ESEIISYSKRQTTWFKKEKQTETSSLALKSLASIGTSLSQECLKEFSLKSKKKIQKQAKALWEKVYTSERTRKDFGK